MNAGIPHGWESYTDAKYLPQNEQDWKRYFEKTAIVAFEPGKTYEYSNVSFGLVELVSMKLSGQPYARFMQQQLFSPLGMDHTFVNSTPGHDEMVTLYDQHLNSLPHWYSIPEGGLAFYSSAADLLKFGMFHLQSITAPRVMDAQHLHEMHTFRDGPDDLFGLGWFNQGSELVSDGNVTGANARITLLPKDDIAIVAIVNRTSPQGMADQVAEKIKQVFRKSTGSDGFEQWQRIYRPAYTVHRRLLGKWVGEIKAPLLILLISSGDHLKA